MKKLASFTLSLLYSACPFLLNWVAEQGRSVAGFILFVVIATVYVTGFLVLWIIVDALLADEGDPPPKPWCDHLPPGWECLRERGHEGLCDARPKRTFDFRDLPDESP